MNQEELVLVANKQRYQLHKLVRRLKRKLEALGYEVKAKQVIEYYIAMLVLPTRGIVVEMEPREMYRERFEKKCAFLRDYGYDVVVLTFSQLIHEVPECIYKITGIVLPGIGEKKHLQKDDIEKYIRTDAPSLEVSLSVREKLLKAKGYTPESHPHLYEIDN